MRVAIGLSGEMRGCPLCLELLQTNVMQPFKDAGADVVDLFIHTRKDDWFRTALDLPYRALMVEENRKRDVSLIVSEHNPLDRGEFGGDNRRAFLYQSYLQQYWSMHTVGRMIANAIKQDETIAESVSYDWVVRARPDCYIVEPIKIHDLDPNVVNVPWNDWWPFDVDGVRQETITDKFAIGNSNNMSLYFNKLLALQDYCEQYRLQGEHFTAWQLKQAGIGHMRVDTIKIVQMDSPYENSVRP